MNTTRIGVAGLALGLLAVWAGGAQAQTGRRAAMRQGRMAQAAQQSKGSGLLQQLNLTSAQKQQIAGIEMADKAQMKSIKMNTALSPADKATQEKAARKAGREKILAVLTPDQKAQLKQLVAQRRRQKGQAAAGTVSGTSAVPATGTAPAAGTPTTTPTGAKTGTPSTGTGKGASADDELGDLEDLA